MKPYTVIKVTGPAWQVMLDGDMTAICRSSADANTIANALNNRETSLQRHAMLGLAKLVTGLNPKCQEIGPGMMAEMQRLAREALDE